MCRSITTWTLISDRCVEIRVLESSGDTWGNWTVGERTRVGDWEMSWGGTFGVPSGVRKARSRISEGVPGPKGSEVGVEEGRDGVIRSPHGE